MHLKNINEWIFVYAIMVLAFVFVDNILVFNYMYHAKDVMFCIRHTKFGMYKLDCNMMHLSASSTLAHNYARYVFSSCVKHPLLRKVCSTSLKNTFKNWKSLRSIK